MGADSKKSKTPTGSTSASPTSSARTRTPAPNTPVSDEPMPSEEENFAGGDAVEQELNELLEEMDGSYKQFSETVFKKMDQMRDKITVLDQTTVDLVQGLDEVESTSNEMNLRSGRVRKRRS